MMKKMLAGIAMMGLVLLFVNLSGGLAYFSDVMVSEGNRLQAGQLEIRLDRDEIPFDESCVRPGETGEGSLMLHVYDNPAWVRLDLEGVSGEGVLSEELVFTVELEDVYQWSGTADEFPVSIELGDEPFENCTDYELTVRWEFPDGVDVSQKDNLEFDMIFNAYQSRHHPQGTESFESGFYSVVKVEGNVFTTGCWIECETAWAYGGDYAENNWDHATGRSWGWTNGPLDGGENYTFELWAGAAQNDLDKGTLVGTLYVEHIDGVWRVTYRTFDGFAMSEAHLWVGEDVLPNGDGNYTAAPGQFPYKEEGISTEYTFEVTGLPSEGIYVAAHAMVCGDYEAVEGQDLPGDREDSTAVMPEEEPEPAELVVGIRHGDEVIAGENLVVVYEVVNVGGVEAAQDVRFSVDGEECSSEGVALDPGDSVGGEFSYSTGADDRGEITIKVATDDDEKFGTVFIGEGPEEFGGREDDDVERDMEAEDEDEESGDKGSVGDSDREEDVGVEIVDEETFDEEEEDEGMEGVEGELEGGSSDEVEHEDDDRGEGGNLGEDEELENIGG